MKRLALALVLIALLLVLNSYHLVHHELYEAYPDSEAVIAGFEGTVSTGGKVVNLSHDSFYIVVTYGSESRMLKVLSDEDVAYGDRVRVLGLLHSDEIRPEKMMIYRKWSYYSIYIRSVIAIPLVLYLFFKYWTFDLRAMRFKRRGASEDA
jgi:hypothetical protein